MTDSVLLYAAGAMDADEAEEVRRHLSGGCPRCAGLLAEAESTVALLALALPTQTPAPSVKSKLMNRIGSRSEPSPTRITPAAAPAPSPAATAPWWAPIFIPSGIAAVVAAGLAILFASRMQPPQAPPAQSPSNEPVVGQLLAKVESDQAEIAALRSGQTSQTVAWAASPNMKFIWLDPTGEQPGAGGRIFWDTKSSTWHFFAHGVKPAPAGKTYELWFVPSDGTPPVAAGKFDPSPTGDASMVTKVPTDIASKVTVGAVTDEPAGQTVTAPTGNFQFKGAVQ